MMPRNFNYFTSQAYSDTGLVRPNNEDAYANLPADGCFVVSDGMGGASSGEIASALIQTTLQEAITNTAGDAPGLRKYEIQQALHRANQAIRAHAQSHHFMQMGATVALLLLDPWQPQHGLLCHLGDSRIYRCRQGQLLQLTQDHTIGEELRQNHRAFPLGETSTKLFHILTRAVGTAPTISPQWQAIDLAPHDVFMLCSDGVSGEVPAKELAEIFAQSADLPTLQEQLITRVRNHGAADNFTFILCRIGANLPSAYIPTPEEAQENAYLYQIAEERIDHD